MSLVSEPAFSWAPERGRFDLSESMQKARRLWERRIKPNLRDASSWVRETAVPAVIDGSVETFVFLGSPLLWAARNCDTDFDEAKYPVPVKISKVREQGRGFSKYVGMPTMAAATFVAALFAPTNFTTRTHIQGYEPDFTIVSQSEAAQQEEAPTYPVMYSREWHDNRAILLAAYAERRARLHPVEAAPVYERAVQSVGGVQVTSFESDDEYSGF